MSQPGWTCPQGGARCLGLGLPCWPLAALLLGEALGQSLAGEACYVLRKISSLRKDFRMIVSICSEISTSADETGLEGSNENRDYLQQIWKEHMKIYKMKEKTRFMNNVTEKENKEFLGRFVIQAVP